MTLPDWLMDLRREEITRPVKRDARSSGDLLLGLPSDRAFFEAIGGGQADFDEPWEGTYRGSKVSLSGAERSLLYAYLNQKGHLEELVAGLDMLMADAELEDLLVVDLGCGPFTAGLALATVFGTERPFTYIGIDTSREMRALGERLARAATDGGNLATHARHWGTSLDGISWTKPPGWQPVLVIVSYLLASPSIDCTALVGELNRFLNKVGRGEVVIFYTNSTRDEANRHFKTFQAKLETNGFDCVDNRNGSVTVDGWDGAKLRDLRYALFRRQRQNVLRLGEE